MKSPPPAAVSQLMPHSPLDFDDLARELDLWSEAGRAVEFWWRDDDAARPHAALTRLLDVSDTFEIEVAVAVVPAWAVDALGDEIQPRGNAAILQHGYAHQNHARAGEPAVECGGDRPVEAVLDELRAGFRRLQELFGARFEPIVAAPWNRIDRPVLDRLAEAGYRGASAFGPRSAMDGVHGLVIANAHVDPLNWRERRFAGRDKALSGILGELRARRTGSTDPNEPLGLLTHHLDHDEAAWEFLARFFSLTTHHPAARWLDVSQAFPTDRISAARLVGAK